MHTEFKKSLPSSSGWSVNFASPPAPTLTIQSVVLTYSTETFTESTDYNVNS